MYKDACLIVAGTADRAVASDAGGPGLKSSHQNFFIKHCLLQTVEKIKIK